MNLLQIFFIISWFIILILSIDIAKKEKFNALHFLVFISVWFWLLLFTLYPNVLSFIWSVFWIPRWADVLVYSSIIFLIYFVLLLLRKIEQNNEDITKITREIAINNSKTEIIKWKEVFIIPAYNEWTVIKSTINTILNKGYKNILVVNDWSKDNTLRELKSFWDKIIVLSHYKNRGQWASLETWFEYVRRFWEVDYVITFDADWQHDIEDVAVFENYFKKHKNIDILLWSRFIAKNNDLKVPLFRKIILKLWIIFTYFLSNIKLSDTHNGFRVIKTKVLNKIIITMDWMAHASEIIDIIANEDIVFKEVPVNIRYSEYSLAKWQKSSNAINIALKVIWNKFFK